ncbi:hypothetical protein P154DRAFT_603489 [Amniculicola lignicola CBS 123094]|uniref:Zn(2)-C6 fungal-type domain-containing protein n=1 Tax=Amniculicola lignicola CBS 123094 TaxID=1392246 RepID=A0A6A5WWL7_9PLEO|nr:hypothetical protein P154DRAFT_603489 [Amniculicola lignicola CBS 123094]
MGDSGTTMATPFNHHHQHPHSHHTPSDHDSHDPLTLNEYGLPELRASLQSPGLVGGNSPSAAMPSFSDFQSPVGFGAAQGFSSVNSYERGVGASPTMKSTAGLQNSGDQRGSISNLSEENMNAANAQAHRLSVGSANNYGTNDGNNTSPESAPALGLLAIGDSLNDSMMSGKLDDSVSGDADGDKRDKDDKMDPPAWSEMKTKAGKDRKRLPLACIACRRKKIRCSGEKPACKHCLRSRIPTDYMAMLDKRLKRMEDRVIKLIPKESLPSVSNVGAPPKTPTAKKRPAEEAFGGELDEWSKTKIANPDAVGAANRAKETDESKLLTEGAESLPPKEIQEHLAEVYFDFVFMRRLAQGKVPPVLVLAICAISARFSTHPQLRSEPAFLRGDNWAITAREIALKRYDAPNITILIVYLLLGLHEFGTCQGGRSWMFGGMAQRMAYALQLHKELEYDPNVQEADRKPLSATDREIRRRTMWSCFLMDRFNSSGTDRPLFVNEQYIEVQLPVKEHLYLHEIQAPTENLEGNVPNPVPPDSGQLSDARENMGVASYTIRLVCIWGKLVKYMNLGGKERETEPMWSPKSSFYNIKREARDFKQTLPEMLLYNPENLKSHAIGRTANHYLYLHILYQQIILFLHRFSLPSTAGSRPPKDMPHDFLTESARTALDAANQISILINESMDYNVVAPFAGYSAFFSSTVHVHGVFSKNPKLEAQSKKYLAYNVKYLSKMKKYWGMFHYMAENLKELYRQHADAALRGSGTAAEGKKGKAMIFQYGDWFDRYPHGVSKTDYEDAEEKANEPGTDAVLGQKSDLQSVEEFFASLSPPSKAEQQRKQARKKGSKSVSKSDAPTSISIPSEHLKPHQASSERQPTPQQIHAAQLQQQQQQAMAHGHPIPIAPQHQDLESAFDPAYFSAQTGRSHSHSQQHPQAFLHDYPPHPHPPHHHQQRHPQHPSHNLSMLSTSPTTLLPPNPMDMSPFPDMASNPAFWSLDPMGPMGMGGGGGAGGGFFSDPSTAWFLPFNVEPPVLGDEGVFGNHGFDFWEFFGSALFCSAGVDLMGKWAMGNFNGRAFLEAGKGVNRVAFRRSGLGLRECRLDIFILRARLVRI